MNTYELSESQVEVVAGGLRSPLLIHPSMLLPRIIKGLIA